MLANSDNPRTSNARGRTTWFRKPFIYALGSLVIFSFVVISSFSTEHYERHVLDSRSSHEQRANNVEVFRRSPDIYDESASWNPHESFFEERATVNVISAHPRLFATQQNWNALPKKISTDPYLKKWNHTIMTKANTFASMPPTNYSIDGGLEGSGVLDVAREVQLRIKHWAYAYRVTGDTKWVDRTWDELLVASGNSTQYFGVEGDNWNTEHWLDVAEFIVAFSYAYDWMYDAWTDTQRDAIMWSIITLGLDKGMDAYTQDSWFLSVHGNWNCVTNGGMVIGALAIYNEDPTGIAQALLPNALANSMQWCAAAVQPDGTWAETSDYWYFGQQGYAQTASALMTATGSAQGTLAANPALKYTGNYHIYVTGNTGVKFDYGDCGPNKYTATANCLMFYGNQYNVPHLTLYQRDQKDAPDPLSMFWYNTKTTGEWYQDLPLDHNFPSLNESWVSMRSSWTDKNGVFVGMKAGRLTGHQTHGDLDAGDFVIDALGQRWAGELCQDNYLAPGYFENEYQNSTRWLYYRCRTEGQNTLLYNSQNQLVDANPVPNIFGTTGNIEPLSGQAPTQGTPDAAYWVADLSAMNGGSSWKRGVRMLNLRRQVLIQDELVDAGATSQWRMHTNATITYSNGGKVATLHLNGQSMRLRIQSPSSASFTTLQPVRLSTDTDEPLSAVGAYDLPNPGVSVLAIDVDSGTQTVAVLFTPVYKNGQGQGGAGGPFVESVPGVVPLGQWSLTSHD